ncbi:uncharacterized protein QYS62_000942 [Fusarium acuminatum]|uniref:Carbohydrate kinase PfkB domain-containing protein n=1 Tax=Fusarium acuminatum TaxID=5515 RepID=A0ABZ2WI00_9HYPO
MRLSSLISRHGSVLRRCAGAGTRPMYSQRRPMSSSLAGVKELLKVSEEITDAVATNKPIVALESTIYTHGALGNELALQHSDLVRSNGGIPAIIAIVDGVPTVGATASDILRMIESGSAVKASRRDIAYIAGMGLTGQKIHGGTTISGTMLLARLAGIRVFGTGGLGGVHRGGHDSMDVSADLTELGRTRVAVISSGCKGFLDIPRTLEFLETQGAHVSTFADGRSGKIDFPAFWARDSGIKSPSVVQTEKEAAAIILAQERLGIESGLLFANPIPEEFGIPAPEMQAYIEQAVREANEKGFTGSANTPYILGRLKELTGEKAVIANKALVTSNITRATNIAVELSRLLSSGSEPVKTFAGKTILNGLKASGLDTTYIRQLGHEYHGSNRTAQYVAVNDANKNLVMAMADMGIFTNHSFPEYWKSAVRGTKPKWLVVDGNWSEKDIRAWLKAGQDQDCKIAFEPVSTAKSMNLFCPQKGHPKLRVFPKPTVDIASPNSYELAAMYSAARENGYLESPEWFDIIDSFGMRGARDRFVRMTSAELTDAGVPVQSVQLLPYIPTIVTKLGPQGVLLTTILGKDDPRLRDPDSEEYIVARSTNDHPSVGGLYMRLFSAAEKVQNIVSVNGVGDTFFGVLISGLAQGGKVENLIDVAQAGSCLTLKSHESVSPDLHRLEKVLAQAAAQ